MAQGRRVERVAALIRREVSELLVTGIKDERVSLGMVSITNVDVAGDLQHCKIFVSVYGSDQLQEFRFQCHRKCESIPHQLPTLDKFQYT